MRRHLNALRDHLDAKGWRAHVIDVPASVQVPYILISPVSHYDYDPSASGLTSDFYGLVRLTCVAGSVDAALAFGDAVRGYLSPRNAWTRVPAEGFAADICWAMFDAADVDRDVTGTALNNHRAFAKHTYHLDSRSLT